ncbi:MAG: primosomal protein N', partial [Pirellulaceae bacterium]
MPRNQQTLFEIEPPAWEIDDAAHEFVATVVLPEGPAGEFDYVVPAGLRQPDAPQRHVEPGRRVRVPLGRANRAMIGYCVALGYKSTGGRKLKSIAAVLDPQPLMSAAMLRLTRWMADYYLCPLAQVLETVVPSGVRQQAGTRQVTLLTMSPEVAAQLSDLKLPKKQAEALQILATSPQPQSARELAARVGCTLGPIQALCAKGLIVETTGRVAIREAQQSIHAREQAHTLTDDQQLALDKIRGALESGEHHGILIHGVTGSGKTEVYIRAMQEVVSFGRQAIVLVPEISLTPQTVGRFRARFDRVAVLHSHQTNVERHQHWQRIARGDVQVIVGARSAVFAPTPHLGLIIIDEEHEPSFKQDTAPRYHARDVAWWRAREMKVPLVLASATPSLESWQRAKEGAYQLLEMPRRVLNRPMPAVKTIDLRDEAHTKHFRG